jgi:hypothetical protein
MEILHGVREFDPYSGKQYDLVEHLWKLKGEASTALAP